MLCFKFYIYFNKPTFVKNHFLKLDLSLLWTNDDSSLNYFVQDFILSMTDVSNRLIFFIQMIKLKPTCQLSNNVKKSNPFPHPLPPPLSRRSFIFFSFGNVQHFNLWRYKIDILGENNDILNSSACKLISLYHIEINVSGRYIIEHLLKHLKSSLLMLKGSVSWFQSLIGWS